MRIVITGASGYLGSHLLKRAQATHPAWNLHATYHTYVPHFPDSPAITFHQLDLRDAASVSHLINQLKPNVIIHTAALMGKDGLEPPTARGEAWSINVEGTRHLAQAAARIHARLVHVSTDVIFDGEHAPYDEDSPPHPIHRYGVTKMESERAVMDSDAEAVTIRTSLIYGFDPLDPRTRAMCEGKMARLFTDEYRNPIWVTELADALLELCETDYRGVLNVAGAQHLNRYEFGVKLVGALDGDTNIFIPTLRAESNLIRPRDCTLGISRATRLLKTRLSSVNQVIEQIKSET